MGRRVVITGIGPVAAGGIGREIFFKNLLEHKTSIRKIPEAYQGKYRFRSRYYVPFPEISLSDYNISPVYSHIMGEGAILSVIGAKLALMDAGFILDEKRQFFHAEGLDNGTVILGLGFSSMQTGFQSHLAHVFEDEPGILERRHMNLRFNRMVIPIMMPNSVSAWVAIFFGMKGANYTINTSCASGTYAIGEAYRKIIEGHCPMALAGGVECLKDDTGSIMRGFDMLGVLTTSKDGNPGPFSKNRSGFLFCEGAACILVLEELEHARKRKADIYAEILGYEANSDAYHIVQMENSGRQVVKLLKKLIRDKKIGYLNSHGTGTVANDDIEARAIRAVFGHKPSQPFINSSKGILGHSLGASGALEAAVTAMSIKESKIHGNLIDDPMDDLNLVTKSINTTVNYAVSTSYGFGGHNAAILFKKYKPS